MRCRQFRQRYSAWVDTRRKGSLADDLSEHGRACPRCAAFVRSIALLEEACVRARTVQELAPGGRKEEAALALADLVVEAHRDQGSLARPRGFILALVMMLGPGLGALLAVRALQPEWGPLVETALTAIAFAVLAIESILHAPPADLSQSLPQEAPAGPA